MLRIQLHSFVERARMPVDVFPGGRTVVRADLIIDFTYNKKVRSFFRLEEYVLVEHINEIAIVKRQHCRSQMFLYLLRRVIEVWSRVGAAQNHTRRGVL